MFPKWMFHQTQPARVFGSELELSAAGPGWAETQFPEAQPAAAETSAGEEVIEPKGEGSRLKRKPKGE